MSPAQHGRMVEARDEDCPPQEDELEWLIKRVHERELMREVYAYLAFQDAAREPLVIKKVKSA